MTSLVTRKVHLLPCVLVLCLSSVLRLMQGLDIGTHPNTKNTPEFSYKNAVQLIFLRTISIHQTGAILDLCLSVNRQTQSYLRHHLSVI